MTPSLYASYIYEREGMETLETEHSFATYHINGDTCYIRDTFVHPSARRSSEGSNLGKKIEKIAISRGCTQIIGSVVPTTNKSTESLKFLLEYGFRLDSSTNNFIVLKKDLGVK